MKSKDTGNTSLMPFKSRIQKAYGKIEHSTQIQLYDQTLFPRLYNHLKKIIAEEELKYLAKFYNINEFTPVNEKVKPDEKAQELENICNGWYQYQLLEFTYGLFQNQNTLPKIPLEITLTSADLTSKNKQSEDKDIDQQEQHKFLVFTFLNEPGLRATLSLPEGKTNPYELQINFFGTIDFASQVVDLDKGGPGQEVLKKHEKQLLMNLNSVIEQISANDPKATFKLRLSGHSLGGGLAKGFAHTLQRALAIQDTQPIEVIKTIKNNLTDPSVDTKRLEKKLEQDKERFANMPALKKIENMTIYALGAPGVSEQTNIDACLLTYAHDNADFIRMYNHHHTQDICVKFGDTEFLTGPPAPNMITNKAIEYAVAITEEEIKDADTLPFPGINQRVMAAHNKRIYQCPGVETTITDLNESQFILDKFKFSIFRRKLYEAVFMIARLLATINGIDSLIPALYSVPTEPIDGLEISNYLKEEPEDDENAINTVLRYPY